MNLKHFLQTMKASFRQRSRSMDEKSVLESLILYLFTESLKTIAPEQVQQAASLSSSLSSSTPSTPRSTHSNSSSPNSSSSNSYSSSSNESISPLFSQNNNNPTCSGIMFTSSNQVNPGTTTLSQLSTLINYNENRSNTQTSSLFNDDRSINFYLYFCNCF